MLPPQDYFLTTIISGYPWQGVAYGLPPESSSETSSQSSALWASESLVYGQGGPASVCNMRFGRGTARAAPVLRSDGSSGFLSCVWPTVFLESMTWSQFWLPELHFIKTK